MQSSQRALEEAKAREEAARSVLAAAKVGHLADSYLLVCMSVCHRLQPSMICSSCCCCLREASQLAGQVYRTSERVLYLNELVKIRVTGKCHLQQHFTR